MTRTGVLVVQHPGRELFLVSDDEISTIVALMAMFDRCPVRAVVGVARPQPELVLRAREVVVKLADFERALQAAEWGVQKAITGLVSGGIVNRASSFLPRTLLLIRDAFRA